MSKKPEEKLLCSALPCSTLLLLNLFLLTQRKKEETSKKMYELKRRNNKYRSHKRNCFLKWHSRVFSAPFDFFCALLCFASLMSWLKTKMLLLFYAAAGTGINLTPMGRDRIDPEWLVSACKTWKDEPTYLDFRFVRAWLCSYDLIIYPGV